MDREAQMGNAGNDSEVSVVNYTDKNAKPSRSSDMTIGDILKSYRDAKDRRYQIIVLSDLTLLPRQEIRAILYANGHKECAPHRREIHSKPRVPWTDAEVELLVEAIPTAQMWRDVVDRIPTRSIGSVVTFCHNHYIYLGQPVSDAAKCSLANRRRQKLSREAAFRMAAGGATYDEIAERLGVTVESLYTLWKRARKEGLEPPTPARKGDQMKGHRTRLTKDDLLGLREQGMSNKDIAAACDISLATVYNLIGGQGKRVDSFAAFDSKPKGKAHDAIAQRVKYQPEVVSEPYRLTNDFTISTEFNTKTVAILSKDEFIDVPFDALPELIQALAYILREKVEPRLRAEREEAEGASDDE